MGDDQYNTQKTLVGLVLHPNTAGVLVLGLGCENNNITVFKEILKRAGSFDERRVRFLSIQEVEDEFAVGMEILSELAAQSTAKRVSVDVSKLVIGLKCGGSDGLSGITANPLVGRISDKLVAAGGATVLTEVPEMFGAETLLMNRCKDRSTFEQTVNLINDFKDYYARHNQVIYENPSPGNKAGGITTLEDKSLGCVQKGGTSAVNAVLQTGDRVSQKGLNLLSGPGNDIVACTNLTAAGAHMILFTTGRGTPLGAPVPTVKISTNSDLSRRKPNWIDFNAGKLTDGESMEAISDELWEHIIAVASGSVNTKSEVNGYREIAIFKDGVTL
jgi:altronate hydrolase